MNWCHWRLITVTSLQVCHADNCYGYHTTIGIALVYEKVLSNIAVQSFAKFPPLSQWRKIKMQALSLPWIVHEVSLGTNASMEMSKSIGLSSARTIATSFCGKPIVSHYHKRNWSRIWIVGHNRVRSLSFHYCIVFHRTARYFWPNVT